MPFEIPHGYLRHLYAAGRHDTDLRPLGVEDRGQVRLLMCQKYQHRIMFMQLNHEQEKVKGKRRVSQLSQFSRMLSPSSLVPAIHFYFLTLSPVDFSQTVLSLFSGGWTYRFKTILVHCNVKNMVKIDFSFLVETYVE